MVFAAACSAGKIPNSLRLPSVDRDGAAATARAKKATGQPTCRGPPAHLATLRMGSHRTRLRRGLAPSLLSPRRLQPLSAHRPRPRLVVPLSQGPLFPRPPHRAPLQPPCPRLLPSPQARARVRVMRRLHRHRLSPLNWGWVSACPSVLPPSAWRRWSSSSSAAADAARAKSTRLRTGRLPSGAARFTPGHLPSTRRPWRHHTRSRPCTSRRRRSLCFPVRRWGHRTRRRPCPCPTLKNSGTLNPQMNPVASSGTRLII